jgi:3-hydroxyisobutyrate dehydrogenase-like beta-hydroxyacid dehydrogenase
MTTESASRPRVGFAGMGRMGVPMAINVLSTGFPLAVYNRTRERCTPLAERGAQVVDSPAELAAQSQILVTMLADAEAVRHVLLGPDGALEGSADPGLVIEMSTIGPVAARELAAAAEGRGWDWIDAPVSGSTALAEQAKLTVIAGGRPDAFERATPVLAAMSAKQLYLGGAGAGAAMKLALNLMVASTTQSVSEALVLAERSGIDRAAAYDAIAGSAVGSPFVEYKRSAFIDPDAQPVGFSLELMQKDLELALALGREERVPLRSATAATEGIAEAAALCGGESDLVRVADGLRAAAGGASDGARR